jgi:hypothetical protein
MQGRRVIVAALIATVAVLLTACGEIVSSTFENVGETLDTPTVGATAFAGTDATLTLETGSIADGPGVSVSGAIANAAAGPNLVNGVVLMDEDGVIWLCEVLTESSPPSCGEPRLRVLNYPEGTADWDISTGELIGLQEQGGVLWREGAQYFGVVEP